MPTLVDLLERVSFLAAMPAVAGVFVTAGTLAISRDWRLNSLALTVQYFFLVLLLTRLIRLEVAAVKGLIGWLICMVFYLTERRASTLEQPAPVEESATVSQRWRRWIISARASFHLLAGILISVAAYTAALRIPLPQVPGDITESYRCGANSYIIKPVSFPDFRAIVETVGQYWMTHNRASSSRL